MSIDENAMFGSDEPPLRRLGQPQTDRLSRQNTLTDMVSPQVSRQNTFTPRSNSKRRQPANLTNSNIAIAPLASSAELPQFTSRINPQSLSLPEPTATAIDNAAKSTVVQLQRVLSDQVSPIRLAGHLAVVVIAAVVLLISRMEMPDWNLTLPRAFPTESAEGSIMSAANAVTQVGQVLSNSNSNSSDLLSSSSLQKAIVPFTIIPEEPQEGIENYTVASGDTVLGIANKFGLKPESIQWANPNLELNPDLLRIGDQLEIPPVDGALHTVQVGDTLSSIAAKYKVDMEQIVGFPQNNLVDTATALSIGTRLIVPDGVKPYVAPQVYAYNGTIPSSAATGSGAFVWPTSGSVTQRYWGGHKAIDIGSWTGAPVKSSDSGHVIVAQPGWNNGYGNMVVVDHGNGFVSLYAHLNSIYVRKGENVSRGQQVGTVGNTGNSTGPHLHLEIRYLGVPRNPFSYLQ